MPQNRRSYEKTRRIALSGLLFALASLIFGITGLFLLWLHSAKRKSTWPLVGAGLVLPAAVAIIFIH